MEAASAPLPCYLVEWYQAGLDEVELGLIIAELDRTCRTVDLEGAVLRRLLTLAVPNDDVVFALFEADSADVVRRACRRAGMPAARLTAALADDTRGLPR